MAGFGSIDPKAGNGKYKDEARIDEIIGIHKLADNGEFTDLRFLNLPILALKQHWIKIKAGKDKREIKVSRWCISFDPLNEKVARKGVTCPYCSLSQGEDGSCQTSVKYYANAIVRDLQADMPRAAMKQKLSSEEKKSGIIQMGSKTWTPVRVIGLPGSLAEKIQKLEKRNIHKDKKSKEKKAFPVTDDKYGIDIAIAFDNSKAGGDKYSVDRGEHSPLTDEEKEYLVWDLSADLVDKLGTKTQKEAEEDFKRMDIIGGTDIEDDEDDDDGESLGSKKNKKSSKKTSKKSKIDDEDEDEDDDGESLGKKSSKKSSSKKSKIDEDDEDEDDGDSLGSKKNKKPLKKKSKSDEEPKKKLKKPLKKKAKK